MPFTPRADSTSSRIMGFAVVRTISVPLRAIMPARTFRDETQPCADADFESQLENRASGPLPLAP